MSDVFNSLAGMGDDWVPLRGSGLDSGTEDAQRHVLHHGSGAVVLQSGKG